MVMKAWLLADNSGVELYGQMLGEQTEQLKASRVARRAAQVVVFRSGFSICVICAPAMNLPAHQCSRGQTAWSRGGSPRVEAPVGSAI